MKVIAHMNEQRVLIEVDLDELAKIIGLPNSWHLPRPSYGGATVASAFPVGREIEVHQLWKIIEHERGRPNAIKMAAGNLHALANMLESVNAMLPTPPTDAAEGG